MGSGITSLILVECILNLLCSSSFPRPARYGDIQLLRYLIRYRGQIEADTQHTLTHGKLLLSKTQAIEARLSASPNRRTGSLPCEILEQIISQLPPDDIDMHMAKAWITWYLATLGATRNHLRRAIAETEDLMCVLNGETVTLSETEAQYPPGTEIRWVPIKKIEQQRLQVMTWVNVLCKVVGFKL